jgi:hypothetical protein
MDPVMRLLCSGFLLVLMGSVASDHSLVAAEDSGSIAKALSSAVRWYFHWQKPLPDVKRLICRAQRFEDRYFAYCEPGGETLDVMGTKDGGFKVNVIATTVEDFSTALRLFSGHQPVHATESLVIPVDLTEYKVDEDLSRRYMKVSEEYMRETLRLYEQRGQHVTCLFPLVSKEDPFYDVYLVQGGQIDSVWHFPIVGNALQDHPQWVYDVPHHNIPETAEPHVKDSTRWLASIVR